MRTGGRLRQAASTVLFMLAVTFVAVAAVSATHLATRETVRRNELLYMHEAVLRCADITVPDDAAATEKLYAAAVREPADPAGCYTVNHPDSPDGGTRVFIESGPGLWGTITAVAGFGPSGTVRGVEFVRHNETPGLGARIDEDWFRDQFRDKHAPLRIGSAKPRLVAVLSESLQ